MSIKRTVGYSICYMLVAEFPEMQSLIKFCMTTICENINARRKKSYDI
jgi:hypothetical protein